MEKEIEDIKSLTPEEMARLEYVEYLNDMQSQVIKDLEEANA